MSLTKALPLFRPRPQCLSKLCSPRSYAYYPPRGPGFSAPQASPNAQSQYSRPAVRPSYEGPIQRDPRLYTPPPIPDTFSENVANRQRAAQNKFGNKQAAAEEEEQWPENYMIPTSHDGLVQLIGEDGRKIGPSKLRETLDAMNLNTHVIKMVSLQFSPTDGPWVRIYDREKLERHEREIAEREKERAAEAKAEAERYKKEVKELKISWGIGEHDLGIKMKKAKEFLEHGKRVHVTLAIKKKMARVELSQMKDLVERIKDLMAGFGGEEYKPMDGTIGRMAELKFRPGKGLKKGKKEKEVVGEEAVADGRVEPTKEN
ncbi:hypothetical protein BJ508DRAFT_377019 [Ascobolus immersus RN42]|uniref:Translation initiation factor 3 C-terminal domain-containing protein n=1 Tax=Ascobolus immersus RN42 TaxID=1160509 RepID=A0A3N4I7H6_ASCIM|nr:hypothetical protein BJ508DRAFT_377019 [Ascobolus immersus RN42]